MRKTLLSYILLPVFLIFGQPPNHPPIVKISKPANHSTSDWNQQVPYIVDVSDPEDGDSKYQEIPSTEVLIKLKYVESNTKASAYIKRINSDTAGIMSMLVSNCFNCHAVKTKMAGPAFSDISKKYQLTALNREKLADHIIKGSAGIWGKEIMPTHPELNAAAAGQMVNWILKYAGDPELNYFVGIQGTLLLNKPRGDTHRGLFIVQAYYTDHGTATLSDKKITGTDQIVIRMK
jgi:cytochrome c